ncbi:MAG TPA: N-acetylneuraminate synthase family protein [Gaiellaceae bacterium]|nr:N-acetylneuraminate synthase family protein [Gaiellaceae bacterium]
MSFTLPHRFEDRTLVVAEAGVNHGGDLEVALEMVAAAAGAGIDVVKFQTYTAGRLATRSSEAYWDRTKEPTATQFELFSRYDRLGPDDYGALADACRGHGLIFLTTPFDVEAVDWLDELVPAWKVASADLTNALLLERLGRTGKPVLLSTGAGTLEEVAAAVGLLERAGAPVVALLHCTLSYPTAAADAAVGALVALAQAFPGRPLGYSDHTVGADSFAAIAAAVALGARIVEKHYTLDATLPGNDHYHAFEPAEFRRLREELDRLALLLGSPEKRVLEVEEPARLHARRSLVSRVAIPAGTVVAPEMLDVKRPGTGIEPAQLPHVVGARAAVDIPEDTTLVWDLLDRVG